MENVEVLLEKYPNTRGDDKLLITSYWLEIDGLKKLNLEFVNRSTSSESIRRARQLIQANGMYLPTGEIIAKRKEREASFKKAVKKGEIL